MVAEQAIVVRVMSELRNESLVNLKVTVLNVKKLVIMQMIVVHPKLGGEKGKFKGTCHNCEMKGHAATNWWEKEENKDKYPV
jgi:hypothetical protein